MPIPSIPAPRCENLLLATLSEQEYASLAPRLHPVHSPNKEVLGERGKAVRYVYFPCTSVLSVLSTMSNGAAVEIGTVGNEGFLGIEVLAGSDTSAETTVCQIEGDGLRMSVGDFKEAIAGDTPLRRIVQRYLLVYMSLISQSVACNRLHSIEERFARWVLMTHDRVKGDEFYLTQEYLADMLGVHRPSVSLVAGAFQQAGLISYRRGHMTIVNRQGLEDTCCECYEIASGQFDNLLGLRRS